MERDFRAAVPNRLGVVALTYVRTWSGVGYVAFVIDACSSYIVGWHASRSLRTDPSLYALDVVPKQVVDSVEPPCSAWAKQRLQV